VNDYEEELLPVPSAAQRHNQMLIEDPDDAYMGNRGGLGSAAPSLSPQRNLGPMLANDDDMSMSLGMPKLQEMLSAKKHAKARGQFNTLMHNKRAADPRTKTGQQTEANVQDMFGLAAPRIQGVGTFLQNMFDGGAPRVQGFNKVFGRKAGNFRSEDRKNLKRLGFFGRLKRAVMGESDAPKRTWMERLFGARKTPKELTTSEKGAFKAQRKGASWADALAPLKDDGSAKWEDWKDEEKASGSVVQIEDKVPAQAQAQAQVDEEDSLQSKEVPQQQFIEEEEKEQDDNQTIDDNSIDNDDDDDDDPRKEDLDQQFFHNYMKSLFK
jgi:hypothetical protein